MNPNSPYAALVRLLAKEAVQEYLASKAAKDNEQLMEQQACVQWVLLKRWCELTGDTKDAVYSRRHARKWADGIHCKKKDGKLWINVPEAMTWIEG